MVIFFHPNVAVRQDSYRMKFLIAKVLLSPPIKSGYPFPTTGKDLPKRMIRQNLQDP